MRSQRISVSGIDVVAILVSFTGDLGWELHCAAKDQVELYSALIKAGRDCSAGPVGSRALMSLRIEKGYGSWGREYSPEYWPQEVGLDRLIKMDKGGFLNRDAYAAIAGKAPRDKLSMFSVSAMEADASGGEPIFLPDGSPVGQVTSGAYGYSVGQSLALGFVRADVASPGQKFSISILGRPHEAVLLERPLFDPAGSRLRS